MDSRRNAVSKKDSLANEEIADVNSSTDFDTREAIYERHREVLQDHIRSSERHQERSNLYVEVFSRIQSILQTILNG